MSANRCHVTRSLTRPQSRWRNLVAVLAAVLTLVAAMPDASAHAELRQASPRRNSVVGGSFHSVAMQFSGLAEQGWSAELLDPAGTPIGQTAVRENQRIVIPIEPLQVPGTYTVRFTVTGEDGDVSTGVFSFTYDPTAAEPEGIDLEVSTVQVLGWFGWALLIVGAALLGWLVHRFRYAWLEHKAATADRSSAGAEPGFDLAPDQDPAPSAGPADH